MSSMAAAIAIRLEEELGDELRTVGTTANLAAGLEEIIKQRHALPAAYVHPLSDRADRNRYVTGLVGQNVVQLTGVLLVVAAQGARRTGPIADAVDALKDTVRATLIGWTPDPELSPVELADGDIVHVGGGVAVWLERYRSDFELRGS